MPLNDVRRDKNRIIHTSTQSNSKFFSRQRVRFNQLTRMDTAFARFDSARLDLLSSGCLARTCLWRKTRTVCKPQASPECYQRQMARCRHQTTRIRKAT